jgi:hypothetical protein
VGGELACSGRKGHENILYVKWTSQSERIALLAFPNGSLLYGTITPFDFTFTYHREQYLKIHFASSDCLIGQCVAKAASDAGVEPGCM